MATMSDRILADLLRREGGFVDDPNDAGGPTKFGITLGTLARFRGREVTKDEVQALSESEAREIYRKLYIHPIEALVGPTSPILAQLVDIAVLQGVGTARMLLMKSGPSNRKLLKERILHLARVAQVRPANLKFLKGWIARAFEAAGE